MPSTSVAIRPNAAAERFGKLSFNVVEVTGAGRLYRAASVWTAGLGLGLPIRLPFVGSVGVCGAVEQMRMYLEVIPRELVDVMREPFESVTHRSGQVNDAASFESLHDAIVDAERVCASVLRDVVPENLLFIFGQTVQALLDTPIPAPPDPPLFYESDAVASNGNHEQGDGDNKGKPKHRAVVLCKLKHSDELEKFLFGKEKKGGHDTQRYEIAWSELQELKKRLGGFSEHSERPNVVAQRTGKGKLWPVRWSVVLCVAGCPASECNHTSIGTRVWNSLAIASILPTPRALASWP